MASQAGYVQVAARIYKGVQSRKSGNPLDRIGSVVLDPNQQQLTSQTAFSRSKMSSGITSERSRATLRALMKALSTICCMFSARRLQFSSTSRASSVLAFKSSYKPSLVSSNHKRRCQCLIGLLDCDEEAD
jgi:hypothetical protein